jgi:hypothetical protein
LRVGVGRKIIKIIKIKKLKLSHEDNECEQAIIEYGRISYETRTQ